MAAIWSLRAGSASSCPAALGNRGHPARLPGAAGTALAYITLRPPSWAWLGALSTMPCIQALAKGLPNAQVQGTGRLCLLCCNFLITAKKEKKEKRGEGRKRAGSRGVGNSKAFLMKASAVSIQDLDLINGSYSQITLRLFSVSQRGASTYRVPFYFVS